jgi:hypothetical protein
MPRSCLRLLLIAIVTASIGSSARFEVAGAQAEGFSGAIACDARGQPIDFALVQSVVGDEPLSAALPNATLDILHPRLAVTCQAVFEDAHAAANPFALPAGRVTFTVAGPGLIVESGGQTYTTTCGDQDTPGRCMGAVVAGQLPDTLVRAAEELTVHVALLSAPPPAPPPAPAAIVVTASYQPDDASDAISVSTLIDLVPPTYRLSLSANRNVIGSASTEPVLVTAHLWRQIADACLSIAGGPFLVCQQLGLEAGAGGAEPGRVVFTTSHGAFVNLDQRIEAPCIDQQPAVLGAGEDGAYPLGCTSVSAKLTPFGASGDALVTATFTGLVTGATASDQIPLTITPEPATFPLRDGCTVLRVPTGVPVDSPVEVVVDSVTPSRSVYAVWRRNERSGTWEAGYLRGGDAALDAVRVSPGDQVAICVDALATFPLG